MPTRTSLALLSSAVLSTAALADNGVTVHTSSLATPQGYILMDDDPTLHIQISSTLRRSDGAGIDEDLRIRYRVNFIPQQLGEPTVSGGSHVVIHEDVPPIFNAPITDDVFSFPAQLLTDAYEYNIEVRISHDDGTGAWVDDETPVLIQRIGHFSRRLDFGGDRLVTVTGFTAAPIWLAALQRWRVGIAGGELFGNGLPIAQYAVTPSLVVDLDKIGHMVVTSGQLLVLGDPNFDMSGFPATRGQTLIGPNALETAGICFELPAGIGWRGASFGFLNRELCTAAGSSVELSPGDLQPAAAFSSSFTGAAPEIVSDAFPLLFDADLWSFDAGVLTVPAPNNVRFTAETEYQMHLVDEGKPAESNVSLWRSVNPIAGSPLTITGGADGGISVDLALQPTLGVGFSSHFPQADIIHVGGPVSIADHRVAAAASRVLGVTATIRYSRVCPPCPGEDYPDPTSLDQISITAGNIPITPTGGLNGSGLPNPSKLRVGELPGGGGAGIHELDGFASAAFQMPGGILPAEDGQGTDDPGEAPASYNPARALMTPLDPSTHSLYHPGGLGFLAGLGNYAGVNYRQFPGLEIKSTIGGGPPVTYDAALWTRGHARATGFTGILQSAPDDIPPVITVFDYDIALDNLGWSYLSNATVKSITGGLLTVPYPSAFDITVQEMMINCCGEPTGFDLALDDRDKTLAYWADSPFHINSAGFDTGADCPNECGTAPGLLKLGVDAPIGGTPGLHGGFLYPLPDGHLTNGTEAEGRVSELVVGPTTLRGYSVLPTGRAFFNNQQAAPLPPVGFQGLPAAMDVSFFEDVEGLIQTSVALDTNENIHFRRSWEVGDDNYFNDPDFDTTHRGFAPGLATFQEYRTGGAFHPIADKDWFGGTFAFPVLFRDFGNQTHFHSTDPADTDLIVGNLPGEVRFLTATDAHVTFGEEFELLPKLTLSNLAGLSIDEATVQLEGLVGDWVNDVEAMLESMIALQTTNAQVMLNATLTPASNGLAAGIVTGMRQIADDKPENILQAIDDQLVITFSPAAITNALNTVTGPVNTADTFLNDLRGQVVGWRDQLQHIRDTYLTEAGMEDLLQQMVAAVPNASIDPDLVEELWIEMLGTGPTNSALKLLQDRADELLEVLNDLELALDQAGDMTTEANVLMTTLVNEGVTSIEALKPQIINYLAGTICEDPDAYSDAELQAAIAAMVRDAVLRLDAVAALNSLLRSALYHTAESVKELVASSFDLLNGVAKTVASTLLFLPDAPLRAIQGFGTHFLTGGLTGYVVAEGDDMRQLRLDGRMGLHLPTQVEFKGWLEYNHLTSEGPGFCEGVGGARAHELEIGASAGYSKFMRKTRKLTVKGKWGFEDNGNLNGFAGSLELLDGGFSWAAMNGSKTSLHMAVGQDEFYLAGGISAEMNRLGFGLAGGFFVGKTCTPDPLAWLPGDETDQFAGFLPFESEFAGGIMYGEGAANIIGRSCLARLRVGAGVGWYGLTGIGAADGYAWGGRFKGTASGELLCIISGKGEVVLDSRVVSGDYQMDGRASISRRTIWGKNKTRSLKVGYRRSDGWNLRR